jgi:hypothetical protein
LDIEDNSGMLKKGFLLNILWRKIGEGRKKMFRLRSKLLASLFTALLLLGVFPAFSSVPSQPHPGNAVWIEPATISFTTATLPPGNKFNITVWVNFTSITNGDFIGAWGFAIVYDNTTLKYSRYGFTARVDSSPISEWFKKAGVWKNKPAFSMGDWDATHKYLLPGESWLAPDPGEPPNPMPGEGTFGSTVWIEFEIIKFPGKRGEIVSSIFFDTAPPAPESKLMNENGARVDSEFTFYPAEFRLTWAPPTVNPKLAVDPLTRVYGPYPPPVVGTTFTEDVLIKELDLGWALTNASFTLTYNDTLLGIVDIWLNTADFNLAATADNTTTPGKILFYFETDKSLSGNVKVATITFEILYQGVYPAVDESPLDFSDIELFDHVGPIPTRSPDNGKVTIKGLIALPTPYLEVVPNVTNLGPEPWVGREFDVQVWIKNLHFAWYLIGIQYRLSYCPDLLEVVRVREGPYLPSFNQTDVPPYTWFYGRAWSDGMFGPHILVGELILPNGTGQWPAPLPGAEPPEDGLITIITFKVKKQLCWPENLTCQLNFLHSKLLDKWGELIPTQPHVNGTINILGVNRPGRMIDVYGGAVNRGYGTEHGTSYNGIGVIWPSPYGGQGPRGNMDLVIPQSVVYLFATVTYNYWPVQSKDVGFEIEGPFDQETGEPRNTYHVRKYANRTDSDGVAWIKFQMTWPCNNPESYFGKYKVTATVDICGVVVNDTLWFDYYYLVEITKVTTDKYCYSHCEDVEVTIEYRSKAQQEYPVLFAVVIQDELETAFGYAFVEATVGGAEFCHWKEYSETVTIHIPKWAFAGIAKIFVSAYDKDPTEGGAPWCPTYGLGWPPQATVPEICIYPY